MTDILKEAQDELAQEKMKLFAKKYGKTILFALVGLLVAAAGLSWKKDQTAQKNASMNIQYNAAEKFLEAGNIAEAENTLSTLADQQGDNGYGILARFRKASVALAQNKTSDALALYQKIADDKRLQPLFRDYATTLAGYTALKVENAVPATTLAALTALQNNGGAWQFSAREIIALNTLQPLLKNLPADKAVRQQASKDIAAALQPLVDDPQTPQAMRERTEAMLIALPQVLKVNE